MSNAPLPPISADPIRYGFASAFRNGGGDCLGRFNSRFHANARGYAFIRIYDAVMGAGHAGSVSIGVGSSIHPLWEYL